MMLAQCFCKMHGRFDLLTFTLEYTRILFQHCCSISLVSYCKPGFVIYVCISVCSRFDVCVLVELVPFCCVCIIVSLALHSARESGEIQPVTEERDSLKEYSQESFIELITFAGLSHIDSVLKPILQ